MLSISLLLVRGKQIYAATHTFTWNWFAPKLISQSRTYSNWQWIWIGSEARSEPGTDVYCKWCRRTKFLSGWIGDELDQPALSSVCRKRMDGERSLVVTAGFYADFVDELLAGLMVVDERTVVTRGWWKWQRIVEKHRQDLVWTLGSQHQPRLKLN